MRTRAIAATVFATIFAVVGGLAAPAAAVDPSLFGTMDQDLLDPWIEEAEARLATDPADAEALRILGIAYHNLGSIEVRGAPAEAQNYLEQLLALDPDDQVARAYLGSATTMRARDSWNVITRVSNANRGINLIDEAVRNDRDNVRLRLLRANHSISLPEMFDRSAIALDDFRFAVDRMADEASSSPEAVADVHYKIAELTDDAAERAAHLEAVIETAPESELAALAREALGQ